MIANDANMPTLQSSWAGMRTLSELRTVLDRATNTLEPQHWPAWLKRLDKELDDLLHSPEKSKESVRCKPKEFALVRVDYLQAAADALRARAHLDAGHSQEPERFEANTTYDWEAANVIEYAIMKAKE